MTFERHVYYTNMLLCVPCTGSVSVSVQDAYRPGKPGVGEEEGKCVSEALWVL